VHRVPAQVVVARRQRERERIEDQIGRLQAWRTSGVSFAKSGKPLYTFIYFPLGKNGHQFPVRTTTMAVCYSKTGSVSELLDCEKAASGITISGAKLYDLVPSSAYAKSLGAALDSLGKTEQAGLKTLGAAKTASVQAKAARSIAKAYRLTEGTLKKVTTTPYLGPAHASILSALLGVANGYDKLASAAAAQSSSRYASASASVSAAKTKLSDAIDALKSLGYSIT